MLGSNKKQTNTATSSSYLSLLQTSGLTSSSGSGSGNQKQQIETLDKLMRCLNALTQVAAAQPNRNIILDQVNNSFSVLSLSLSLSFSISFFFFLFCSIIILTL
jgi:hypothetical protein